MQSDVVRRAAVKRQVEFYFGDSNLPRDKFLKEKIDEEPEGFVSIALIISFSRMCKTLGLPISTPPGEVKAELIAEVAEVLRDCESLTVSEDGTKVKRSKELLSPERLVQTQNERSLFAQPFPYDTTLEDFGGIFGKFGTVNCVRMRRHLVSKDFKGSVFVEFSDKETADKVCEMKLEHAGAPLHLEHKVDYMNRKVDERHGGEQNGVAHAEPGPAAGAAPAVNAAPGPAADGVAAMDTAEVAPRTPEGSDAEPQQLQQQQPEEAIGHAQANGAAEQNGDAQQGADQNAAELFVPGTILQFSLDEGNEEAKGGLNFRGIRPIFGGKDGGVKHCEYRTGSAFGYVRFETAQQATSIMTNLPGDNGKVDICGCSATLKVLEGQQEQEYLRQADAVRMAAAQRANAQAFHENRGGRRGGGGRGRGGRGGRGGGRGRGGRGGRGQKRGNDGASHDGYKLAKTE